MCSKLFIGLEFPYEGPAPLEAIAHGCVFINPKFSPPHNSLNTKFFAGKPTLRQVIFVITKAYITTAIRLRYDYDTTTTKNWRLFFACVELEAVARDTS